jgi:hypothetical protein
MSLERTFRELCAQCLELRDALLGLRMTVVEDCPQSVMWADACGDTIEDLLGRVQEMLAAVGQAQQAVRHPQDLDGARLALTEAQESYLPIQLRFAAELVSYDQVAELVRLGRERGRSWQNWVSGVRQALDACQAPIYAVNQALLLCWQDYAERAGMVSATLQASVAAQPVLPSDEQRPGESSPASAVTADAMPATIRRPDAASDRRS